MLCKYISATILFVFFFLGARAQTPPGIQPPDSTMPMDTLFFDIDKDIAEQLLPIDTLLQIAFANSPALAFEDALIRAKKYDLKYNRMMFFQGVSGFFSINAGDRLIFLSGSVNQQSYQYSNGYSMGIVAQIPLSTFLGQGARNKTVKSEWEAAQHRKEMQKLALKRDLLKVYVDMIESQRKVKIRAEDAQAAFVTVQIAEEELIEGKIASSEFSRLRNTYAIAQSNLESERANFLRSFYDLEALIGVDLRYLKKPVDKKTGLPKKPTMR